MHIHQHTIAYLTIQALILYFVFFTFDCELADKWTKEIILLEGLLSSWFINPDIRMEVSNCTLNLCMTHSLKNGWFQILFYFTLWYCLIKRYMKTLFLFYSANTKISKIFVCKLIIMHAFGKLSKVKHSTGYFPSLFQFFPGKLKKNV